MEVTETPTTIPGEPPLRGGAFNGMAIGPVSYADAVQRAAPAVVNVHTAKVITRKVHPLLDDPVFRHFFGNRIGQSRQDTDQPRFGVLISKQGYVLTNNHVIDGADEIQVLLADGRSMQATVERC